MNAPPFDTREELRAWLDAGGVSHLDRLSLWSLAPRVQTAYLPQLQTAGAGRPLVELLHAQGLARWEREAAPSQRMRDTLPALAWELARAERASAEAARAEVPERLRPPSDDRALIAHQWLLALRDTFPTSIAPRLARTLNPLSLAVDDSLPGVRMKAPGRSELPVGQGADRGHGPGFIWPEAVLRFGAGAVEGRCSCGATACVHLLATIDALLLLWGGTLDDGWATRVQDWVRPSWERTLRALEAAEAETGMAARGGGAPRFELRWHLSVIEGYGVEVTPVVQRRTRAGRPGASVRLSRRKLLQEYGLQLTGADARIAALLPEREAPASRALLIELANHPHLVWDRDPELPVRVERAEVGLVAEDRAGTVILTAGVDGAPLPPAVRDQLRRASADDATYLWDGGSRLLTLLDAKPELRSMIAVLSRHDNAFPPESHPALLEKLSALSARLPVSMPRSVMGEAVPTLDRAVLRFEAEPGGAVRLELRSRPLADGPSFVPGEGARDVHLRRGTGAVHAVRDFVRELAEAERLATLLPLQSLASSEPHDSPFTFRFSSAQGALAVLAALPTIEPEPELEWRGEPLKLAGQRGPKALKTVLVRKRDWFGLKGELSIEGERVELARLLEAARRQERFVQAGPHTYVELESALRAHLEKLSTVAHRTRHGLEVGPSAAEVLTALELDGAEVEADRSWQSLVERIFAARDSTPAVPKGLQTALRGYQLEGFRWLARLAGWGEGVGAVLADDMGLGKTVQTLALLLHRAKEGPALVLAPTSVAFNWMEEAQRFAPGLRVILYGEAEDRGRTLEKLGPRDVLVLSYGLLTRDIERLSQVPFATLVFDEAQNLKNPLTHRVRAARVLRGGFRVALSGTPLENHLGELWSLFAVVFPTLLGSWEGFRTRFATPIERKVDPTAAPALARVLQPFLLRRTKAQVEAQLPPRTDVRVPVVLSPPEWTMYEDARLAALSELEGRGPVLNDGERRIEVLAALTRLRLLASHPQLYDPATSVTSSKLERLLELLRELNEEGQRSLVFSQFTSHLKLVREALERERLGYQYLDGSTPARERRSRIQSFQEGADPVFLISLKAGGFGLNLTAATSVILLDPWWNPAVEDQASDRAHRIGQQRPVTVYRLVAKGTIEEQMLALHAHKRALVADVLEGKDGAGRLSTQELLGLLSQRLPEVGAAAGSC